MNVVLTIAEDEALWPAFVETCYFLLNVVLKILELAEKLDVMTDLLFSFECCGYNAFYGIPYQHVLEEWLLLFSFECCLKELLSSTLGIMNPLLAIFF